MFNRDNKICIIGDKGALGKALTVELKKRGYNNVVGCHRPDVDLTNQIQVRRFFELEKPDVVFFVAALAAGIEYKRQHPAEMLLKNMQMVTNVFDASHQCSCKKLINVCSTLVYPSIAKIPLNERSIDCLELNDIDTPYVLAKASSMKLAEYYSSEYGKDYITVIPCNFFGENSPFDGDKAGVVPSLIRRMNEAKVKNIESVEVWGTGNACRDVLNTKDVASACVFIMECDNHCGKINIGRGKEYTIREIAETVKRVTGYSGKLVFNSNKPEGRMHTQVDSSKLFEMGWQPRMNLEESIRDANEWFLIQERML